MVLPRRSNPSLYVSPTEYPSPSLVSGPYLVVLGEHLADLGLPARGGGPPCPPPILRRCSVCRARTKGQPAGAAEARRGRGGRDTVGISWGFLSHNPVKNTEEYAKGVVTRLCPGAGWREPHDYQNS
jgi:hypothetical protein